MVLNNSGTITSPGSDLLFLTGHWGPPGFLHTFYTNSGTFSGGQIRLYGIPATIYESGQVHATLYGLSDASDVHVMGLPTIDPTLECGGTNRVEVPTVIVADPDPDGPRATIRTARAAVVSHRRNGKTATAHLGLATPEEARR